MRAGERSQQGAPAVTVVIASYRDWSLLSACLDSILPQCEGLAAQVIVARPSVREPAEDRHNRYPGVEFLSSTPTASIPVLRGTGLAASRGDVVVVVEDHCIMGRGWLAALLREAAHATVVGGGVSNARTDRLIEWAAYFSEYGFFSPSRPEVAGAIPLLTGANVAYRRSVVGQVAAWASVGEWENVIHDRLATAGHSATFVRSAVVYQNAQYAFVDFCRDRFHHGYAYARRRLAEQPGARRLLMLAFTPLLPLLQTLRVGRAVSADSKLTFLRALPLTVAFFAAWSAGEAIGYLRGALRRTPAGAPSAGGRSVQDA